MRRMLVGGKLKSKNGINSRQIYARSFDDLRSPMSSGEVLAEGRLRAYGIILTHLPLIIQRPTCSLPVTASVPKSSISLILRESLELKDLRCHCDSFHVGTSTIA